MDWPAISILIPVRNEESNIDRCLEGIFENDYPLDKMQVIVVDGCSTDRTADIVRDWMKHHPQVELHTNPERVPYTGLNIALARASNPIVARVDARSIIPGDYFKKCVRTLLETGADNVGGVQKQYGQTPRQKAIACAVGHPLGVGNAEFRLGWRSGFVDTVYLGCFRRELFDKLGGFDADGPVVSEDSAFNQRIRDSGGRVYLNHEIVVQYPAKTTYSELARQYFIYGGAKAHIVRKYRKLTSLRQGVPLIFVLVLVFSAILAPFSSVAMALFGAMAVAYLTACLLASFQIACFREKKPILFFYLLPCFPCIHFSWAFGFCVRFFEGQRAGDHWRK